MTHIFIAFIAVIIFTCTATQHADQSDDAHSWQSAVLKSIGVKSVVTAILYDVIMKCRFFFFF